jgi:hypothetical protein
MKREAHQPEDKIHPKNARRPNSIAHPGVEQLRRTQHMLAVRIASLMIIARAVPCCLLCYP